MHGKFSFPVISAHIPSTLDESKIGSIKGELQKLKQRSKREALSIVFETFGLLAETLALLDGNLSVSSISTLS